MSQQLSFQGNPFPWGWSVPQSTTAFDEVGVKSKLLNFDWPCYVVQTENGLGISNGEDDGTGSDGAAVVGFTGPFGTNNLGSAGFREAYGTHYSFYAGAMANGIASEELVIALGQAGFLGSFGAAGLVPARIEQAIQRIQAALPNGPYGFNLIHSPSEPALEQGAVEMYLKYGVRVVEASAFLDLTPQIVYYRAAGLSQDQQGNIQINNKVIAKISRREVASKFMQPAPEKMLNQLVEKGLITQEQANLAKHVPMADDITAEADSGGHTDNRPMLSLLPSILSLRDEIQEQYQYPIPIRVGAGGGIGTPSSVLATFMMGADFIVTGSVNQACVEAGASEHTRKILAQADMADVTMAPAADMFEMGVKLQVLKRGTLFPMRAQKLYEFYTQYNSIEEIPADEREKLEKQVFRQSLDSIWEGTMAYFNERDPHQIQRALDNPKRKMALIFRWYLGLSSRWSNAGEGGREMDYQIWCGPAMGAFNAWVKDSYLEEHSSRKVVDVAIHLMTGAAFLYRVQTLKVQGVSFPPNFTSYHPFPLQ